MTNPLRRAGFLDFIHGLLRYNSALMLFRGRFPEVVEWEALEI
ncbi:hypothetical protein ACTXGQ_12950 [Marinobacter sp. 1Y8]